MQLINDINELKNHCNESPYNEFCLKLNFGLKSTKRIQYWDKFDSWCIFNEIDDSMSEYNSTEDFVKNEPMIVKAMSVNAFFKY